MDDVSENGLVLYGVSYYDTDANRGNRDLYIGGIASGELSALRETKASEYGALLPPRRRAHWLFFTGGQLWLDKVNDPSYLPVPLTDVEGGLGDAKVVELNDGRLLVTFVTRVQLDQTPAERHPEAP